MRFFTRALTQAELLDISGWRYAAPYDVYDGNEECLTAELCRGICDAGGALWGFFCWGSEAQVAVAQGIYETDSRSFDFGIGLHPSRTGSGFGTMAVSCALDWLREAFHPQAFRLAVKTWNVRAQRVYRRLGFLPVAVCGDFLMMSLDERSWRDATRPLVEGIPVYPGDPPFSRSLFLHKEESGFDASQIAMCVHTGTHVDAPAHIGLPGGVETLAFPALNGCAQLVDWSTPDFAALRAERVLFKNMARGFTPEEANSLLAAGVRTVAINRLSVGCELCEKDVHSLLLSEGVTIVENAALDGFSPGWYHMRCLPLLIPGSDGAPARLLLREEYA